MRRAFLTIDDTPSASTDALTGWLAAAGIPAILFCRGDRLAGNPDAALTAIERGFTLANHAYSHQRASAIGFQAMADEISRTEAMIDDLYRQAGIRRAARHFRFPHMDRGCGGWIVDYDAVPAHRETLIRLFSDGLNIDLAPPTEAQQRLKDDLQDWLRRNGFTAPAFDGVRFPWYADTEMAAAVDAMFTYSTSDWMVTPRHAGRWPYATIDDLKVKIDDDPWLADRQSAHIILAHDQDDLFNTVKTLINHFRDHDFNFISTGETA